MHARFTLNLRHRLTVAATCALVAGAPGLAQAGESAPSAASLSEEALQLQAPSSETSLLPEQRSAFSGVLLPPPAPRLYAITPERRALLNTIRYAEGTWANGDDIGYRIMFGGGLMPHMERHPDRVIRRPRYASAAAGAYQFMPFTWRMVSEALGLERFGPQVQDQGALFLIQRRGALALVDRGEFTPQLAHKLAPEWASFPTLAGRSYYGQPVKRFDALKTFYEQNLAQLRAAVAPPEPAKPVCGEGDLRCRLDALERLGPQALGG
ncbi:MAG: glycoside hydrolase family 104 protein [Cyanobacteriota bacterium]|jgi:muramidase (phage lysozyme)|nr:glycoside hydrolase family 104 protein [Cyanobacteriota bacterium]